MNWIEELARCHSFDKRRGSSVQSSPFFFSFLVVIKSIERQKVAKLHVSRSQESHLQLKEVYLALCLYLVIYSTPFLDNANDVRAQLEYLKSLYLHSTRHCYVHLYGMSRGACKGIKPISCNFNGHSRESWSKRSKAVDVDLGWGALPLTFAFWWGQFRRNLSVASVT